VIDSLFAANAWYIAAQDSNGRVQILRSTDSTSWTRITPPGYTAPAYRATGYPQKLMTASQGHVYLIGRTGPAGGVKVWASGAAGLETEYSLPGTNENSLPAGVATADGCPIAVAIRYPPGALSADGSPSIMSGMSAEELDSWWICKGKVPADPATLSLDGRGTIEQSQIKLFTAGSSAVVAIAREEFKFGRGHWLQTEAVLPGDSDLVLSTESVAVSLSGVVGLGGSGSGYTTVTGNSTTTPKTLPPGRLPDAGTAPADNSSAVAGCGDSHGFVVVGYTQVPSGPWVGSVWSSPDGVNWHKLPVTANGMQSVGFFFGAACADDGTVLLLGAANTSTPHTSFQAWTSRFDR
jgi:hypothetical protein